jgi:hypothetical protein
MNAEMVVLSIATGLLAVLMVVDCLRDMAGR